MFREIEQLDARQVLNAIWSHTELTKVEKEVVQRYYGFKRKVGVPQSIEEIAETMKIPESMVSAHHLSALLKLKETVKNNKITYRGMSL